MSDVSYMFLWYSRETITTKPRFEVSKEISTSSRIRAIVVKKGNKSLWINALLDDRSTRSYINKVVTDCLVGVERWTSFIYWMLGYWMICTVSNLKRRLAQLSLESCNSRVRKTVAAQTTKRLTWNMQAINWVVEMKKWPHLSGMDFLLRSRRPLIDMLIALDLFDSHCSLMEGNLGEPIVRLTSLSWTSIGPFE